MRGFDLYRYTSLSFGEGWGEANYFTTSISTYICPRIFLSAILL